MTWEIAYVEARFYGRWMFLAVRPGVMVELGRPRVYH